MQSMRARKHPRGSPKALQGDAVRIRAVAKEETTRICTLEDGVT